MKTKTRTSCKAHGRSATRELREIHAGALPNKMELSGSVVESRPGFYSEVMMNESRCALSAAAGKPATPPATHMTYRGRAARGGGERENTKTTKHRIITVPPFKAPWRPTRLVRVLSIKFTEDCGVQDEGARYPLSLLCFIPLPIHQVLEAPASPTYIQYSSNSISRVIVNDPGGWRGFGWRA